MSLRSWSSVKTSYEVPLPLSIISRDSTKSSTSPMLGTPRIPLKTSSEKAERTCSFTVDMAVTLGRERKIVNLCVFTSTWRTFGCGLSGLWESVVIQTPLGVWDTTYHVCECEFRPCNRVASRLWRRGLVSGKGKCPARSRRRARYTTQRRDQRPATTMNSFHPGESSSHPFVEPTPFPASIPKVNELGATSAPLKSAAFFIGAYCKEFNGGSIRINGSTTTNVGVSYRGLYALQGRKSRPCSLPKGGSTGNKMCDRPVRTFSYLSPSDAHDTPFQFFFGSITKMRENCLQQFEAHWSCLEMNNQVCFRYPA